MKADNTSVHPEIIREIALWWQGELDRCATQGQTADLPAHEVVMKRFRCSEEEALRGVGLGEHRHFSGID